MIASINENETWDCLLVMAVVLFVALFVCAGGCVNQYKNRVTVEVPAGATTGPISVTVTDHGDQVPTTTKNVIPTASVPGI